MLVCAATHSLELPWKPVANWMAQMFVDFEPGIHYPQIQMQSAMSGGAVIRMYNPVTQARALDPQGEFVRRWVPELAHVSPFWIFEPWQMTPNLRQAAGWTIDEDYPKPLVDFTQTHRATRQAITEIRATCQLVPARGFHERNVRDRQARSDSEQISGTQAHATQKSTASTLPDLNRKTVRTAAGTRRRQSRTKEVDTSVQPTLF